jgi:hypothetical protein
MRVELTWVTPHAPQTCAYTNSAIPAACSIIVSHEKGSNKFVGVYRKSGIKMARPKETPSA